MNDPGRRTWSAALRDRFGVHVTVLVTMAVALLSIATGIAHIGVGTTATDTGVDELEAVVPPLVRQVAGFTGTVSGFALLASAFALRERYQFAWYVSVALLPATAIQALVQANALSGPLVALSILALPLLVRNRGRFDRSLPVTTPQALAGLAVIGVLVYGTIGAFSLREEFAGVRTPLDAFYYTVVTATTVGYGDVTATSQAARLFGLSVVVLGTASFGAVLGTVLAPLVQTRLRRALGKMTESQLERLDDHVLVLGSGDVLTESIVEELSDHTQLLVLTADADHSATLADLDVAVFTADPRDEESLRRAGIDRARAVIVATADDADDALAVLTARQLNPDIRIVAAASHEENVEKLKRAGATAVVSPAIVGHLIAQSALGREDVERVVEELVEESVE